MSPPEYAPCGAKMSEGRDDEQPEDDRHSGKIAATSAQDDSTQGAHRGSSNSSDYKREQSLRTRLRTTCVTASQTSKSSFKQVVVVTLATPNLDNHTKLSLSVLV
eukprot:639453-Prymnesium_polylepis.1